MSANIDVLHAEVLRLSPPDRARLLDRIIASLDQDAEAEAAWNAEADRRDAELDSGAVKATPFSETMARLEARFPG